MICFIKLVRFYDFLAEFEKVAEVVSSSDFALIGYLQAVYIEKELVEALGLEPGKPTDGVSRTIEWLGTQLCYHYYGWYRCRYALKLDGILTEDLARRTIESSSRNGPARFSWYHLHQTFMHYHHFCVIRRIS